MSDHFLGVVYLSGAMTGIEDHGLTMFGHARGVLRGEGYTVLCPSEASLAQNTVEVRTREFHLRRDISMVLLADQVCVLPGWEVSKGAAIEVCLAVAIGIPVWEFDTREFIHEAVLETMDPRRFIVPVDFMDWYEPEEEPECDFKSEYQQEMPPPEQCTREHIPFRGASSSRCIKVEGHKGDHEDAQGRGF